MVINLDRCIGCQSCSAACRAENLTERGMLWQTVLSQEGGDYPSVWRTFIPKPCMQCEDAECVRVCPTGASAKRPDGIVTIDSQKCIGCEYCILACPFKSRSLKKGTSYFSSYTLLEVAGVKNQKMSNVVSKCDFCQARLEQGLRPACVSNCLTDAMIFGDLEDPKSDIAKVLSGRNGQVYQMLPVKGVKPSVFYTSNKAIIGEDLEVIR